MRHSTSELTLPHDQSTWVCPTGRCFPLMTVRYVGAIQGIPCVCRSFPHSARARKSSIDVVIHGDEACAHSPRPWGCMLAYTK